MPATKVIARTFPIKKTKKASTKITKFSPRAEKTVPKSKANKSFNKPKEISSLEVMSAYRHCWPILGKHYTSFFSSPKRVDFKVKLSVAPTGKVSSVTFLQNTSHLAEFNKAVITALQNIKFPALNAQDHKKIIMAFSFPD